MKQFQTALGLYLLWSALAWLSNALSQTTLNDQAALVLLFGIAATNALFFLVARSSVFHQPPPATVALAQCVFATTWITLYAFMCVGAGELVPAMYFTAVLFAMFRVPHKTFTHIIALSACSYSVVALAKTFIAPDSVSIAPLVLSVTAFLGISLALLVFARHIHGLRGQLMDRNADLQSMIKRMSNSMELDYPQKSFNHHFVMETLAREKGRADRTNQPFSLCVIEPDRFESLIDEEGQVVAEKVAHDFSKRLRAELRSMDAISSDDRQRLFGRVTADVFVIVLPATGIEGALNCAERIRGAIADQPFLEGCRITASAGIAEYRRNETIQSLRARAEAELKIAHGCGGNCVSGIEFREPVEAEVMALPAGRR